MPPRRTVIKISEIEKVAALQCTYAEAAAFFGIKTSSFKNLLGQDPKAKMAWERGLNQGKLSIRRKQMRLASVNSSMAIHLGKNYLEQQDKVTQELTGKDGAPVQFAAIDNLNDVERKQLRTLLERARPPRGSTKT